MKNSKSLCSIILVLSLAQTVSQAQMRITFDNMRYEIGLKQGLSIPYIHNSAAWTNQGDRTGFHFGAYASIRSGKVAVQPEIVFSRQQHTYSFPLTDPTTLISTPLNFATNFDYINVPIIFKYYVTGGLNLQAGPQFSWLFNGASSITAWNYFASRQGNLFLSAPTSQRMSDFVRSSDIAVAVGLGWDLPNGLNFTARYNMGLIDMNKQSQVGFSDMESSFATREAKNHVLQISMGYHLLRYGK